jgi:transposase
MKPINVKIKKADADRAVKGATFFLTFFLALPDLFGVKSKIIEFLEFVIKLFDNADSVKNSQNSDLPQSKEIQPEKKSREKGKRKPGGQTGHVGKTLTPIPNPTKKVNLTPVGYENNPNYRKVKTDTRQLFDIVSQPIVTEYTSDVYENVETGERIMGTFPPGVTAPVQYGPELKALVVTLRNVHHLSYEQIANHIKDRYSYNISEGTLVNIVTAAEQSPVLNAFEEAALNKLETSPVVHADETAISVKGVKYWVHLLTCRLAVFFCLHWKRGKEAMDDIGFLGQYCGTVVHDFWKPYFKFTNFLHAMCNAHLLRELEDAFEMGQKWAYLMQELLLDLNILVSCHGGLLPKPLQDYYLEEYRKIINIGLETTGGAVLSRPPGCRKRGRVKKAKYRNLLERLRDFEDEILRFMTDEFVPFTNNDAERPVRMIKVHMKISGCFRSPEHANGFLRMHGYIVTCKRHGMSAYQAVKMLIEGQIPDCILKLNEAQAVSSASCDIQKAA